MFLYPPRPEKAVPPSFIKSLEARGFVAQKKKNGTCQVISIDASGNVEFRTRRNEPNKAWTPLPEMIKYFSSFKDSVFVGELLHNKHESVKNTIFLFDVLHYLGRSQVGSTLETRLEGLRAVVPFTPNIKLIDTYYQDLTGLYYSLSEPTDEGIVLKNPKAVLRDCKRDGLNANWQVKCRVGTKNYGF
jgi:ATP-dependent DNA ligase